MLIGTAVIRTSRARPTSCVLSARRCCASWLDLRSPLIGGERVKNPASRGGCPLRSFARRRFVLLPFFSQGLVLVVTPFDSLQLPHDIEDVDL